MGELIRKSRNVPLLMYHPVFAAEYRRLIINKEVDNLPRSICSEIPKRYETVFPEIGTEGDHVHFLIRSVPTYSPSEIVTTVESLTAGEIFSGIPSVGKELRGGEFRSDGYSVCTVGEHADEDVIRKYIKKQGRDGNYKQSHKIKNIRKQITLF